jgi:hypothetical protein
VDLGVLVAQVMAAVMAAEAAIQHLAVALIMAAEEVLVDMLEQAA